MRKFLVKNYVLDYKIFGLNAPRASRITYPLFILTGVCWIKLPLIGWFILPLLLASLFFEFIYFRIYPAQYNELDNEQKKQYDAIKNN